MAMLEFVNFRGGRVYVNQDHIVTIGADPTRADWSIVTLSTGEHVYAAATSTGGTAAKLAQAINTNQEAYPVAGSDSQVDAMTPIG